MPDFGAPVASGVNVNPNQGLTTISNLMGLQQKRQAIQSQGLGIETQEAQLPAQQAESQLVQQKVGEQQAVSKMMQSGIDDQGNSIRDANGEPDPAKILPALGRIAPLTGQTIAQNILQTHTAKVGLQAAATTLDSQQRAALMGPIQAIATNPADPSMVDKASTALDQWAEKHPEMGAMVGNAKTLLAHISSTQDPAMRAHLAQSLSSLMQGGQAVQTQPQAGTVNTGAQVLSGTVAPPVAGGGFTPQTSVQTAVPPGLQTFQDQAGNTWAYNAQSPGHAILVGHGGGVGGGKGAPAGHPGSGQPTGAEPSGGQPQSGNGGPPTLTLGEADVVKQNTQNVNDTRKIAADSQTQHDILNRIQSIASTPGLYVGPGSENVAKLANVVAQLPGMEGAAKYANNYNEMVKFMAQNAARMGSAMGLSGSDARLDLALHSQPNATTDARTVQNVAQYMSGLVKMGAAKADAMDKWLQQPGNSLQNEQNFERLWRDSADPRIFQLNEMKDQGEAQDYAKLHIRKSELADIQKKHDTLKSLGAIQ